MHRPHDLKEEDYQILYNFALNYINDEINYQEYLPLSKCDQRLEERWYKEVPGKSFKEWYDVIFQVIKDVLKDKNLAH